MEPEEPVLYLNTLFSVTASAEGVDLGYIVAVLNSRLMSAAYERWTNRLFGDKFPKVSKLDLARLPIPRGSKVKQKTLSRLGRELNTQWPQLKGTVSSFFDEANGLDESGKLGKKLAKFWDMKREDVIAELARTPRGDGLAAVEPFVKTWKMAVHRVNDIWGQINDLEREADAMMRDLSGLDSGTYDEVVSRVPEITLEQVLLPR